MVTFQSLVDAYPLLMMAITGLGMVVPLASFIANLTPNKTDDKIVAAVSKVIDFLALNFTVRK